MRLGQTKAYRVSEANGGVEIGNGLLAVVNEQYIDAIQREEGSQRVGIRDGVICRRNGELLCITRVP